MDTNIANFRLGIRGCPPPWLALNDVHGFLQLQIKIQYLLVKSMWSTWQAESEIEAKV